MPHTRTTPGTSPHEVVPDATRHIGGLRKLSVQRESLLSEAGRALPHATTLAAAAAVIRNPWSGTAAGADLTVPTREIAPRLARLLTDRLLGALGGIESVEAFGKAAVVGEAGEIEHGAALIHTPYFGNLVREWLGGESIICFADARGGAGEAVSVPMWHKTAASTRSHYQTMSVRVPDAPRSGELVVIAAASTGPRPLPRIGDRTTDPVVTAETMKGVLS